VGTLAAAFAFCCALFDSGKERETKAFAMLNAQRMIAQAVDASFDAPVSIEPIIEPPPSDFPVLRQRAVLASIGHAHAIPDPPTPVKNRGWHFSCISLMRTVVVVASAALCAYVAITYRQSVHDLVTLRDETAAQSKQLATLDMLIAEKKVWLETAQRVHADRQAELRRANNELRAHVLSTIESTFQAVLLPD